MDKVCLCTNITKSKIKEMVHAKNMSWKKFIQETGATTYCGACFLDLKNHFFYYKYQKKISQSKNLLLFKDI
jgi:bacterioferritin-associated ferredoxin